MVLVCLQFGYYRAATLVTTTFKTVLVLIFFFCFVQNMADENAVALKLAPFWTSQPRVWFQQTEAQFALKNITADSTKYYYVIAALDQETAARILDLLERPPTENKYLAVKQRLLNTFAFSKQERAARLLNMPELGDRKPTVLMDEMLALLGDHTPCFLFNYIFLQHLPEDIRPLLAEEEADNPRRLAQRADVLCLARSRDLNIAKVTKKQPRNLTEPRATSSAQEDKVGLCFYHRRFADKARRCVPPCSFQGNLTAGRR